ncbi:Trichothecene 3-O-acetyltransferase [Taphrina deformans PYCC 5710]|uniref:Trichothecene 3-O-acetyltransferase n=1 Tax=Taphrina deformans (strain PYCC 5710 / ATCC 11124 / CBS 356.35 / IMI 108563 / JCM 9778 / NBRC 8474) TaxID=1097556 RepID=R4XED9_TAPDE|nr:Trichothecene 3-O-acetyltransferase [Taphrina deformans PYCC 5710]|eukprot:CCG82841.1 Trichothecene 3-O-acetyltransferase [Taphrina deformans PYCC 5710]
MLAVKVIPIPADASRDPSIKHHAQRASLQLTIQDKSQDYNYHRIKSTNFSDAHFPLGVFDDSAMPEDITAPVSMCKIKATFIEGGLILGVCYNHLLGDAFSYDLATAALARHCNSIASGRTYVSALSELAQDRSRLVRQVPDRPDKTTTSCLTSILPPHEQGYTVKEPSFPTSAQVFRISPESLYSIKTRAGRGADEWISTHDAVCALIFRTFVRARHAEGIIKDEDALLFSIAIDIRKYLPDLPQDWIGNAIAALRMSLTTSEVLSPDGLASIAAAIRTSIKEVTTGDVKNFFARAIATPGYMLLDNEVGRSSDSTGMMLTTWRNFAPGKYDWPVDIGHFQVMRYPKDWQPMGWIVIWPDMEDGTWEISTVMEEHVAKRFSEDEDFLKSARPAWQR